MYIYVYQAIDGSTVIKVSVDLLKLRWLSQGRSLGYGAPFVACTLLLTEANFVQQKSLLSNKSHFCLTKVILSMTKEILSTTKLLLSDKSNFVLRKIASVNKSNFVIDKITFVETKLLLWSRQV